LGEGTLLFRSFSIALSKLLFGGSLEFFWLNPNPNFKGMEFKEGDMVSVFEGTHNRGNRTTKFIGRVVGFDSEKNLWKVRTLTLTLTLC